MKKNARKPRRQRIPPAFMVEVKVPRCKICGRSNYTVTRTEALDEERARFQYATCNTPDCGAKFSILWE